MTEPTPAQTAADLRTAATVAHYAGFTRGTALHFLTGGVCALGALQLATGVSRLYTDHCEDRFPGEEGRFWLRHTPSPESKSRITAAATVLAELLPEPCPKCTKTYASPLDQATARVIHFNDHVCRGGDDLIAVLTQAAEKKEADL